MVSMLRLEGGGNDIILSVCGVFVNCVGWVIVGCIELLCVLYCDLCVLE